MSRSPAEAALERAEERVRELEAELETERSLRRRVEAQRNQLSRLLDETRDQRDQAIADATAAEIARDAVVPSGQLCEGRR